MATDIKGICECGCGQPTRIATKTDRPSGRIKGRPMRFLFGHNLARPLSERLWEKVDKSDGCWIFTGSVDREGYGRVRMNTRRTDGAHRVAWRLANGPIPDGLHVLHRCDVPRCCRPDHLFLGDQVANNRDMVEKWRHRNRWTAESGVA